MIQKTKLKEFLKRWPLVFRNTARIDTGDLDKIRYYR